MKHIYETFKFYILICVFMEEFRQEIIKILVKETNLDKGQIGSILEVPPDHKLGDFAFPTFSLAKTLKKSPTEIAQELAKHFEVNEKIQKVEVKGPYLNFFVNKKELAKQTIPSILKEKQCYGSLAKKDYTIMVEFCSPNTNKPLHLGHLRNIFIGQATSKIFEYQGYDVKRTCLVNDRGIHIMKSMLAYQKFGNNTKPNKKSDKYVGDFYVKYSQAVKNEPSLDDEAKLLLQKWEQGDKDTIALWKKMNKWVYDGFDQTYKELGVKFDKFYYESEIYKEGKDIVMDGLKKGIFEKEEGAIIVNLEKHNLPNKVLIRSDGTSIYMTQDIYLAKMKFEDYPLKSSVYVVGNEQNLHFKQLFKILELLDYSWAKGCYHLNYGMVNLPEGRMKSREGTVVDADDIIKEVRSLAAAEVKKRYPELEKVEVDKRAREIGDAALRFFILKIDASKDMVYNPKEAISFEGETGPYVQYTYARIASILRKHGEELNSDIDFSLLSSESEHELIRKVSLFQDAISDASSHYKPNILARYLLDLAQIFNEFYHKLSVLNAEPALRDARLALAMATKQVLHNGLALLCINTLEKM